MPRHRSHKSPPLAPPRREHSFTVYDSRGNVWPPGFVSQTADPKSPHYIGPRGSPVEASARATAQKDKAAEAGVGWAGGELGLLGTSEKKKDLVTRKPSELLMPSAKRVKTHGLAPHLVRPPAVRGAYKRKKPTRP